MVTQLMLSFSLRTSHVLDHLIHEYLLSNWIHQHVCKHTRAFHNHYTGEVLNKEKVVEAVRNEFYDMVSFSAMQWRKKSE